MPPFSKMQPCVIPPKRFVLPKNVLKGVISLELQVIFVTTFYATHDANVSIKHEKCTENGPK